MKRAFVLFMTLMVLTVAATAGAQGVDERPALVFVLTGQSNGGQQGSVGQVPASAVSPVDDAFYHAPQHTRTQALVSMRPYRNSFGAELSFARAIREACPGRKVIVVKRYLGGTSIIAWDPTAPSAQWKRDMAAVGNSGKGPQYPRVLEAVRQARSLYGGPTDIAGVLWIQVERDSRYTYGAARYEDNLRELVAAFRSEWGAPNLPVVAMDSHTQLDGGGATVHRALLDVAAGDSNFGWVETRDLPTSDGIHFNSGGVLTFGQRLAAEWLRLAGGCGQ